MLPKASSNPSQLDIAFGDQTPINVFLMRLNQKLDLFFQVDQLGSAKCNCVLAFWDPSLFTVKSGGRDVRSKERDTCETKKFGGGGRRAALRLGLRRAMNQVAS